MSDTKKIEKTEWEETANRFVVVLDILGFKEMVARSSHEVIYEKLQSITKSSNTTVTNIRQINDEDKTDADIEMVKFSDSIMIFSKNDSITNFQYLSVATALIFSDAISEKLPIKGGMAHGMISFNKEDNIYFGQPIIGIVNFVRAIEKRIKKS